MTIITTDDGTYKTPGFMRTGAAIVGGSYAKQALIAPLALATVPMLNKMKEKSSQIDNKLLRTAVNDAFSASGLRKNGVEFIDVKSTNKNKKYKNLVDYYFKLIDSIYETNPKKTNPKLYKALKKETPKIIKKLGFEDNFIKFYSAIFESGDNAAFCPKSNSIVVNLDKLGASSFHEMGHAMNKNQSFFWKSMQKLRAPGNFAASLFATTALFKRKKIEGEEPTGIFDKVTTFVKNNVGTLVTLAFVPMVAEELMATRKGEQLAKKFLPKNALKKVKFTNRLGAASYIAVGIASGAGAYVASKVRDKIAKPKQID